MKSLRIIPVLFLSGLLAVQSIAAPKSGQYLRAADINVTALIPPAPANDSLTTAADVMTLLEVQKRRTPESIALATYYANHYAAFQFAPVIGAWFNPANLPFSASVFERIAADRRAISDAGKAIWNRPRPPLLNPQVHACIPLPLSGSYPSGHSTMVFVWAGILADLFPDKREALTDQAELIAWTRIIGGVHYLSDVAAGRMLGTRLAQQFLLEPALQADLRKVRDEMTKARQMPRVKD